MPRNPKTYNLKRFDMQKLYPPPPGTRKSKVIVAIGKRGTGKSVWLIDLMRTLRDIPSGLCICPTERYSATFQRIIPALFIFDQYSDQLLHEKLHRQKKKKYKQKKYQEFKNTDVRSFIILDDCLKDIERWIRNDDVKELFFNGRHFDETFVFSMQYPIGIPPKFRTNVDFVVLFRDNANDNLERIYKYYAGMFDTFADFRDVFNQCTEDYGCMIIDKTSRSNKIEDIVFHYKVDKNFAMAIENEQSLNFQCCSQKFWQNNDEILRKKFYNDDDEEEDEKERYTARVNKTGY